MKASDFKQNLEKVRRLMTGQRQSKTEENLKSQIKANKVINETEILFLSYDLLHHKNLNLLSNELVKSRARISAKRMPSTRFYRQTGTHKSSFKDVKKIKTGKIRAQQETHQETAPKQTLVIVKPPTKELEAKNEPIISKTIDHKVFKVGSLVQLLGKSVRQGRSKKMGEQWLGPYVVLENLPDGTCKIRLGRKQRIVDSADLKKSGNVLKI